MQVVFAFRATLVPRAGQGRGDYEACFKALAAAARAWAAEKRLESPEGGGVPAAADEAFDAERRLFTLNAAYPLEPGEAWRYLCEVAVARTTLGMQTHVILRVRQARDDGLSARYEPFRPGVVDRFLELAHALAVGGEPVPTAPERYDVAAVPRLVDDLLLNPARQLPVVLLTPAESGRPLVSAARMFDEVLGLAHVAELATRHATFPLTDRLGKLWSCFNGAVRLYWPKIVLDDSYKAHPLWFPDHYPPGEETDERLPLEVLRKLVGAAARRSLEAPLVTQLRAEAERAERGRTEARLAELAEGVAEGRQFMAELEKTWQENSRLAEALAAKSAELDAVQDGWATIGAELADAKAAAEFHREAAGRYRARLTQSFRRVHEAVDLAKAEFADTLLFLPSALDAARDSPYQHPAKLFGLLEALHEAMRAAQARGTPGDLHAFFRQRGYEYKPHISTTSEGKFGDEYRFVYEGKRVLFENHVTLGGSHNPQECLSVHFLRDDARRLIVVGWCGKHRTNTRT